MNKLLFLDFDGVLFDTLREMDKRNIDIVYSEEFPNIGVGQAIMNRLLKSAGYKIINA